MTYQELMMKSLMELLEGSETLRYPIYATLIQKNKHWYGFFGLTERYMLNALLEGESKIIGWTTRVPLEVKNVQVKNSLIPGQYKIKIEFLEGEPCNIRCSKKVVGFDQQEENLNGFIQCLKRRMV